LQLEESVGELRWCEPYWVVEFPFVLVVMLYLSQFGVILFVFTYCAFRYHITQQSRNKWYCDIANGTLSNYSYCQRKFICTLLLSFIFLYNGWQLLLWTSDYVMICIYFKFVERFQNYAVGRRLQIVVLAKMCRHLDPLTSNAFIVKLVTRVFLHRIRNE